MHQKFVTFVKENIYIPPPAAVQGEHVSFIYLGVLLAAESAFPRNQQTSCICVFSDEIPEPQCLEVSILVQKSKNQVVSGLGSPCFTKWQ